MSKHIIEEARYIQGLASYRAGHTIRDFVGIAEEMSEDNDPSFLVGFLDGILEDIRSLRHGTRA
jgi:hypothetical protein